MVLNLRIIGEFNCVVTPKAWAALANHDFEYSKMIHVACLILANFPLTYAKWCTNTSPKFTPRQN